MKLSLDDVPALENEDELLTMLFTTGAGDAGVSDELDGEAAEDVTGLAPFALAALPVAVGG